jgi:hypothetical protein
MIKKSTDNLEILQASFWEHEKFAMELARIYSKDNPKRELIAKHSAEILKKIHKLQNGEK